MFNPLRSSNMEMEVKKNSKKNLSQINGSDDPYDSFMFTVWQVKLSHNSIFARLSV